MLQEYLSRLWAVQITLAVGGIALHLEAHMAAMATGVAILAIIATFFFPEEDDEEV